MMIATSFIVILGLAFSYGYSVPLSRVKISDNGLMGYILHNDEDNQKSGFVEGHNIFPRSFGSEFKIESDYMESDSKPTEDDNSEEVMIKSESRFGDYGAYPYGTGGFQSFLPFPPPHHGPNPGPYTPPFSKQQNAFPGVPGGGWDNNFGHGPCHGNGCGRGGHGHGHGFGNDHGYGQGHGGGHNFGHNTPPPFGHGNVYGHGNDHGYGHGFGYGQGNGQGHGFGHGQGHGYGHGYGHGHGHGYGHGHGHGNGNGKDFGGDDSSEENEQLHSTEKFPTPTPPIINVTPPVTPVVTVPVTSKPQTSAPITTEPTYDIDIRLGSSDDS